MHTDEQFPTENELAARLDRLQPAPADGGRVICIVRRPDSEQRELPVEGELTPEDGLVGDRWKRYCTRKMPSGTLNPDTQITIMGTRILEALTDDRERWALAGDNLLVDLDLSHANLAPGQRLQAGTAVLEITAEPHNGCAKFSRRFGPDALRFINSPEGKNQRMRGVHAQVVVAGRVRVGDRLEKIPRQP